MPIKFRATEIGFSNGLGGASNSQSSNEAHYFLFGVQKDNQHPEENGVYFEYDDQKNGGVNIVKKIIIDNFTVTFYLKAGDSISADCIRCKKNWKKLIDSINDTFPKELLSGQRNYTAV